MTDKQIALICASYVAPKYGNDVAEQFKFFIELLSNCPTTAISKAEKE